MRDKTIDNLRCLAMFEVIIVHVLYYGKFVNYGIIKILKSFLLFEMPLFFFVMGASSLYIKDINYKEYVIKRFLKLLIPYWIYSIICFTITSVKYLVENKVIDFAFYIRVFLSWLIPINNQITTIPYITYALWFIPVYLCVTLFIPPLIKIKKTSKLYMLAGLCILLAFVFSVNHNFGWICYPLFYLLWTYIGLFFYELKAISYSPSKRIIYLVFSFISLTSLIFLNRVGQSMDMQQNKFPPNFVFLIYSMLSMSLILFNLKTLDSCFEKLKNIQFNELIRIFSKNTTTIFLYQGIAFCLTIPMTNLIYGNNGVAGAFKILSCFIFTVLTCFVLGKIFKEIENKNNTFKKIISTTIIKNRE